MPPNCSCHRDQGAFQAHQLKKNSPVWSEQNFKKTHLVSLLCLLEWSIQSHIMYQGALVFLHYEALQYLLTFWGVVEKNSTSWACLIALMFWSLTAGSEKFLFWSMAFSEYQVFMCHLAVILSSVLWLLKVLSCKIEASFWATCPLWHWICMWTGESSKLATCWKGW